jgi:hypothetical protein
MEPMKDAALGQAPVLLEKCNAKGKTLWLTFASLSETTKKKFNKIDDWPQNLWLAGANEHLQAQIRSLKRLCLVTTFSVL